MKYLIILLFSIQITCGQNTCDSLTTLKNKIYNKYDPIAVSDSINNLKWKELDQFWKYSMSEKIKSASCINELLIKENKDSYFCFDASALLVNIDKNKEYRGTVINGLLKSRIEHIQLNTFLQIIIILSKEGYDISELATKYLSSPKKKVLLKNHFLSLNRTHAGILIYGTMDDNAATKNLIKNILSDNPEYVKHSSSVILYLKNTKRGNNVLDSLKTKNLIPEKTLEVLNYYRKSLSSKPKKSKEIYSRNEILKKISWVPFNFKEKWYGASGDQSLLYSTYKILNHTEIDLLRKARNKTIFDISDESLHEYFALTKLIFVLNLKKE